MFTVYTRSPQKKKTTITQYLYGTKKYRWLNDVCQWYQYQQDTQWSKQTMSQGIVQQSVAGSCITSYLSRVKLDQIQYLQDNQVSAKAQYNKDIQGNYQTQEQNKNCKCGDLYRVYVKRTAQWNSDRCKWKQPIYQIYYTVNEQVSDQAVYERDSLGCITKIEQSLYMNRLVSSYQLQQFGGLQNLTVFPQQTMQEIEFMNWVPIQQEETCLCSPVVYNFYRYRKASLKDTAWTTDSLTYQCSTDDLPVFIQGYKQQDQPCYTRSQQRQFIQSIKKKLSQQDIQDIKNQLQQQDIENPPQWSVLQQPPICSSVYRIDRHYLFNCQEVKWEETYTDDYGFVGLGNGFSLSDSNYVRTYYQNDNQGNLDYQTSYLQYVGQHAVLHVRIAKAFSDKEATKQDAVIKRYLNPKKLFCCIQQDTRGSSLISESEFIIGINSDMNHDSATCISLFRHNSSYFIQVWQYPAKTYFFSIVVGKIKGIPICLNHSKYRNYVGQAYSSLWPTSHVYLLTSQAVYVIDLSTGLCQLLQELPQVFTSVTCTTGSCCFIATTAKDPSDALYCWAYMKDKPYMILSSVVSIYKLCQTGSCNAIQFLGDSVLCVDTQSSTGSYLLYTFKVKELNDGLKQQNIFQSSTYNKLNKPTTQSIQSYLTTGLLQYFSTTNNLFTTYSKTSSPYPQLVSNTSRNRTAQQMRQYLAGDSSWVSVDVPDIQSQSSIYLSYDQWYTAEDTPAVPQYTQKLFKTTNKQSVFCKQQIFDDFLLLRPTAYLYNPVIVYFVSWHNKMQLQFLNRTQVSVDQNYAFKINFKYVWNSRAYALYWDIQQFTITSVTTVGTNTQGYNQEQTQYTGQVYVTPDIQLSSIYFKMLKPGLPYKGPSYPSQTLPLSGVSTVYMQPVKISRDSSQDYIADATACKAAYGQLFTGNTVTKNGTCYCIIYTDADKTSTVQLQGQCVLASSHQYIRYNDIKLITDLPVRHIYDYAYVYNCLVLDNDQLTTFYAVNQSLYCRVYLTSTYKGFTHTVGTTFTLPQASHATVFTYIQYKQLHTYNIYTAYLSQDKSSIQLRSGQINTAAATTLQAPTFSNYISYYTGQNLQNIQWLAMARQFGGTVSFISTTHIGYYKNSQFKLLQLDQQYYSKLDIITAPWFGWGTIFVTMTKDNKKVVFISFDLQTQTYTKHVVNVEVPDDQNVYIKGVSCYDTREIGVVIGPYTTCTAPDNYKPWQRLTLVKYKLDGQLAYISCNKVFKIQNMVSIPGFQPIAFNSGSSVTYQLTATEAAQNAAIKSYDRDLFLFNLESGYHTYVLDIKTETVSIASVST